jgi:transposase
MGKKSTKKWTPDQDKWGNQVIRVGFPRRTCQLCPSRSLCTRSDSEPRRLTLRPKKEHELLQSIRVQQETDEWQKFMTPGRELKAQFPKASGRLVYERLAIRV